MKTSGAKNEKNIQTSYNAEGERAVMMEMGHQANGEKTIGIGRDESKRIGQRKMSAMKLCMLAMAVGINVAGGQLALMLRLPIYLDSIGTILTGLWMGPLCGMLPNLLSGVILGMTTDIYSLYFAPVGMITGLMAGFAGRYMRVMSAGRQIRPGRILLAAIFVTIPGTAVSSVINAVLFGGVTSSGSSVLVQLLAKTPLGLTGSIFAVQILTDYLDRVIALWLALTVLQKLPAELRGIWKPKQKKVCENAQG